MQTVLVPGNIKENIIRSLIETLNVKGWTLQQIADEVGDKGLIPVSSSDEALKLLSGLEIGTLGFSSKDAGGSIHVVRVDMVFVADEMIYNWTTADDHGFESLVRGFVEDLPTLVLQPVPDLGLDAAQLRLKYMVSSEHPQHSKCDWKEEVHRDDTIVGYWDWVLGQIEAEAA